MNNILFLNTESPADTAKRIASRVKARRLELNLTQEAEEIFETIKSVTDKSDLP